VRSAGASDKGDCTLSLSDSDFVQLMTGKLNPQAAFMKGKLKIKGNVMLAQKLSALMPQKPKPKAASAASGEGDEQKSNKQLSSKL
jgi:putative sterol carrier protein